MGSRFVLLFALSCLLTIVSACRQQSAQVPTNQAARPTSPPAIHVYPGEDIQTALDNAVARSLSQVIVHAGEYRPPEHRQALIWFNHRHNGLHLRADGHVVLTAANPQLAHDSHPAYPAIVNHVVYFGDGIGNQTKLSGFTITGANNYVTTQAGPVIEPEPSLLRLQKTAFHYTDGGAVKIFGRSYPTLENLTIVDNFASPNAGGISIEHRGCLEDRVVIRNCVFRRNRAPLTGAAIALLDHEHGSRALMENCLFAGNLSNEALDHRSEQLGTWESEAGHGAVTVFASSQAEFHRCTFVANRNGVDDRSQRSRYQDCVFWENQATGGWPSGDRYDARLENPATVEGCFFGSNSMAIDPKMNMLQAPDPQFDEQFAPRNPLYHQVGYLPSTSSRRLVPARKSPRQPLHSGDLTVRVEGREFAWYFQYAGQDAVFGTADDVVSQRHLYIPARTLVTLQLGSQDYVYQLALPQQETRQIAVPRMTHECSFQEDQPGIYTIVGDQFCGYAHPDLIGKLIVKAPQEFQTWIDQQSQHP